MNEWKERVLDGLVINFIYRKEHKNNPRLAINDLINSSVDIALDPKVSTDASDLIERGRDESLKTINRLEVENSILRNTVKETHARINEFENENILSVFAYGATRGDLRWQDK